MNKKKDVWIQMLKPKTENPKIVAEVIQNLAMDIPLKKTGKLSKISEPSVIEIKRNNIEKINKLKQDMMRLTLRTGRKAFREALKRNLKKEKYHTLVSAGESSVRSLQMLSGKNEGNISIDEANILLIRSGSKIDLDDENKEKVDFSDEKKE